MDSRRNIARNWLRELVKGTAFSFSVCIYVMGYCY